MTNARKLMSQPPTRRRDAWLGSAGLAWALMTGGCAIESVEWRNPQPRQELLRQSAPPGSIYTGWRVFQDKCAGCHGQAATGATAAPDLLPIVRAVGPRRFVDMVLTRYDWNLPPGTVRGSAAQRETLIDDVMERKLGPLSMPAWQGEPRVSAHIADLHAYLMARAQGQQGPGRPTP